MPLMSLSLQHTASTPDGTGRRQRPVRLKTCLPGRGWRQRWGVAEQCPDGMDRNPLKPDPCTTPGPSHSSGAGPHCSLPCPPGSQHIPALGAQNSRNGDSRAVGGLKVCGSPQASPVPSCCSCSSEHLPKDTAPNPARAGRGWGAVTCPPALDLASPSSAHTAAERAPA